MKKELFYLPLMKRDEVKEAVKEKAVLLVHASTVEQHGLHLPLSTDVDEGTQICLGIAEKLNPSPRVLVSPPFWFLPSFFDCEKYPGTTRIRKETFLQTLNEILDSYIRGGFKKIVLINAHFADWWVPPIVERIEERKSLMWPDWQIPEDVKVAGFTWCVFLGEYAREELLKIRKDSWGCSGHAGDVETSLMLYLKPELVDMNKAKRGTSSKPSKFAETDLFEHGRSWNTMHGYHAGVLDKGEIDGIKGDATKGSQEKGEKIFKLAVNKISEFVKEFAER